MLIITYFDTQTQTEKYSTAMCYVFYVGKATLRCYTSIYVIYSVVPVSYLKPCMILGPQGPYRTYLRHITKTGSPDLLDCPPFQGTQDRPERVMKVLY